MMFFFRNVKLEKEDDERNQIAEEQLAAAGQKMTREADTPEKN